MAAQLKRIPRKEKLEIANQVRDKLVARADARKAGGLPADPGYDEFVVDLDATIADLTPEVQGVQNADATRTKRLADLDEADDEVDYGYRLVEGFLDSHGKRRHGAYVAAARKLHDTAFRDGLAHIDDAIPDENRLCREALDLLQSADWAPVVTGIALPQVWLKDWEVAINLSDTLYKGLTDARTKRKEHVGSGQDGELGWQEVMTRFRKFVGSRTKRSDKTLVAEAKDLTAPLTDALEKMRIEDARRQTEREKKEEEAKKAAAKKAAEPAPAAPAPAEPPKPA